MVSFRRQILYKLIRKQLETLISSNLEYTAVKVHLSKSTLELFGIDPTFKGDKGVHLMEDRHSWIEQGHKDVASCYKNKKLVGQYPLTF